MDGIHSLFLAQSIQDDWASHEQTLSSPSSARWDYIILTSSNENQKRGYEAQLNLRKKAGHLPLHTRFAVLDDPNGERVGSGCATLNVLRYIAEQENRPSPFTNRRILVIHSGGDAKRVSQYSAVGKLFSPVPRLLPDGRGSTLFDEFLIKMSSLPSRFHEGMLVLSGDVLLLFNPLQIDLAGQDAAAISFKQDAEIGKNHGVYQIDPDGNVSAFLHKQSVSKLHIAGAVDQEGLVNIDTGTVFLSPSILHDLYGVISTDHQFDSSKFTTFCNKRTPLSFYGDFMFPLASNASLVEYLQEPAEIPDFSALSSHRKILWEKLHPYRMKVICLSPAQFIHFGTTKELLLLMTRDIAKYTHLDWSANITGNTNDPSYSVHNAFVTDGAHIGSGSYLEHSIIGQNVTVGSGSILSYVMVTNTIVPENVVLHGFELQDGRFVVRIYGIDDNPKESVDHPASFLGTTLQQFMQENGLSAADLWADHESHSLWDARLYPVCDTIDEAVHAALNVYAMTCGKGDVNTWRVATRESLASSYPKADIGAILDFQAQITRTVQVENFLQLISQNGTLQEAHDLLNHNMLDEKQIVLLRERANASSWSQKMRIYYYMGRLSCGTQSETFLNHSFDVLRQGVFSGSAHHPAERIDFHIATPDVDIRLPLRVNWGGGWSDTPPICHEHGGTVLNVAIFLNGNLPVQGELHQLDAKHVILESTDTGAHGIFTDLSDLQDCHNPYDPFALHKAALIACGVIPRQGGNLSALLHRLGGGFSLSTQVLGVPKGSGLGTSSILASACVKGIFAFMGQPCSDEAIFDIVLCMEQLMSTGGGWQDQVGGVIPGIKYIHTLLSMQQSMRVCKVEVPAPAMQELGNRFALIYTGQRRMARNLLREIVGHYLAADPTTLAVLEDIQKTAALMRFELERGRIDAFASLINRHWELSKALDKGSTNTCIDQIFLLIDDLIDGRMICGAGGGGFLQVILKKNATHQQLRERLRSMFHDTPVDVWDCAFV